MKKITTTIIALAILLSACSETTESAKENVETNNEEQVEETSAADESAAELITEGTEVEEDHRYDNLSNESATSECYIVGHFTDMDITYVTVDFIDIEEDFDNGGYEIINENKKLRTFVVNDAYLNPFHEENVSIEKIFEKAANDAEILFSITVEDGLVSELYENLAG